MISRLLDLEDFEIILATHRWASIPNHRKICRIIVIYEFSCKSLPNRVKYTRNFTAFKILNEKFTLSFHSLIWMVQNIPNTFAIQRIFSTIMGTISFCGSREANASFKITKAQPQHRCRSHAAECNGCHGAQGGMKTNISDYLYSSILIGFFICLGRRTDHHQQQRTFHRVG